MSRTANQIRTALTDTTVAATFAESALKALHDSLGGHPTQTPGAAPQSGHTAQSDDADIRLTTTEAAALVPDKAARALKGFLKDAALLQHYATRVANTAVAWGNPALDDTAVARRLHDIDRAIWCHNCHKHGHNNPRQEGRTECRDCADFRREHGVNRTGPIIDRQARGIALRPDFIAAELVREYGPGWRKQMPKPPKAKKRSAA